MRRSSCGPAGPADSTRVCVCVPQCVWPCRWVWSINYFHWLTFNPQLPALTALSARTVAHALLLHESFPSLRESFLLYENLLYEKRSFFTRSFPSSREAFLLHENLLYEKLSFFTRNFFTRSVSSLREAFLLHENLCYENLLYEKRSFFSRSFVSLVARNRRQMQALSLPIH